MHFVVAPAQFVDEFAQPRREIVLGVQALLQPFADGVADRRAGLVVDLFELVVDSGFHGRLYEFHLAAFARLE